MNYDLNEEQIMLKDSARKFLTKHCTREFVREMAEDTKGFTPHLWNGMAELGWMGLLIPEIYGGYGGDFLDLALLLSEMGYCCLPGPFFSSVLGCITLLEAASEDQKARIFPDVASGKMLLTLAWMENDGTYSPDGISMKAEENDREFVLSGTKLFVPDAHVADMVICVAKTQENHGDQSQGISLFLVDNKSPGITIEPLETMVGDKQFEVHFDEVKVPKKRLLGDLHGSWTVLKNVLLKAGVAKCAEMMGGSEKVMELVVPYTKVRTQFGHPVGSFQAVQHHCANMLACHDTIQFMTYLAAWRIAAGLSFEKESSMCKAWVNDAYHQLVALGHQVIGGVGFMEEHDLQLYFKRAKESEILFGRSDFHRENVAEIMDL